MQRLDATPQKKGNATSILLYWAGKSTPPKINLRQTAGVRLGQSAFTLVEMLATIAIIGMLLGMIIPAISSYATYAKQTADKQTLLVLNDALSRYKQQGGSLVALTAGAPIGNVLTALRTPVTWAGISHQFLKQSERYSASSISAKGTGSGYHFYEYDSYNRYDTTISVSSNASNVTITGGSSFDVGDTVTLTAPAQTSPLSGAYTSTNPHWIFQGWYNTSGNTLLSTDTTYTFTASASMNIEARYALATATTSGVWYEWDLASGQKPFDGFTTSSNSGQTTVYWYPDVTTYAGDLVMEADVSNNISVDTTYVMYLYMITAKTGVSFTQTRHFTRLYPNLSWNSYSQGYNGSWVDFSSNSGTAGTFLGSYSNNGTGAYSVPGASGSISNLTQNLTYASWTFDEDLDPVIRFHR